MTDIPTAIPNADNTLLDRVARAIFETRPDCQGRKWPIVTRKDARKYTHEPIAAVDLSYAYAKAAINVIDTVEMSPEQVETLKRRFGLI